MPEDPPLPDGVELEAAIGAATSGALPAEDFAAALRAATLLLAVTSQPGDESVTPLVIEVEGIDFGVACSSPAQYDLFGAETPFVLMPGADIGEAWPVELGLAINPGSEAGILLAPEHLGMLVRGAAAGGGAEDRSEGGAEGGAEGVVPAGTSVRIGAPDPGLPDEALDLLRRMVRSEPDVTATYQLAVAVDDGPAELAVGVEPAPGKTAVAEQFAARAMDADEGFRGVPFFDLDGNLLAAARQHGVPLA